jgi:hypothetical protein
VIFVDYNAEEDKVPYLLDEFNYMWETPFSQTDPTFPCNFDRPLDRTGWERKLYMVNHQLNVEFPIYGGAALVPNILTINQTNGVEGFGSLGLQANSCLGKTASLLRNPYVLMLCTAMWGRYPNFLLVDFYDAGAGSVFEVAAKANNVTYHGGCCGKVKSTGPSTFMLNSMFPWVEGLLSLAFFVLG